jgi:allantoinase
MLPSMDADFVVRGARVFLPTGEAARSIHVHKASGKVLRVADYNDVPEGVAILEAGACCILPGLVDTHVHINDPGRQDWEGFETATRAAAAGGVTTLVDMPLNSIPPTTTLQGLAAKLRALEERVHVDVALTAGLVRSNPSGLVDLAREGVVAFKCFLAESGVEEFSHVHERELREGMRHLAKVGAPLFVHAELPEPLEEAARLGIGADPRAYATYLASRPKRAEDAAVELVIAEAERSGARAHIVHLSSADALPLIEQARLRGVPLTAETCPHYLTLCAEEIADGATAFKCAPPIRERANRDALWRGLSSGVIDQVVTDHSPSTVELKCSGSGDFMKAWGGISSLQLGLSAVWTHASRLGIGIDQLVGWMSAAPARLVGLYGRKGAIAPGFDADLVLWDPEAQFVVSSAELEHRNKVTPYEARQLRGRVVCTLLRGHRVYEVSPEGRPTFAPRRGNWLRHS